MRSNTAPTDRAAPVWQVWAALLIVYVVWGSTYLAIRVVVETMPPFLAGGIRFTIAGIILGGLLALGGGIGRLHVTRRELASAAVIGLLLLGIGNALVSAGEVSVPSGIAALVIGVVPLLVLSLRFVAGERIPVSALFGIGVGFVGLAVLAVPGGLDGTLDPAGMLLLVIASISWSIGSFLSKRVPLPRDPFVSTTYQLLAAGIVLLLVAVVSGESRTTTPFSAASIVSLVYLITFGSLVAYTAYTWLLQHSPISRVATYAYVNPVVAVFLGAVILNEQITVTIAFGAVLIVASVAFTIWTDSGGRRRGRQAQALSKPAAEIAPPEVATG